MSGAGERGRFTDCLEITRDALKYGAPRGVHIGRTLLRLNMTALGSRWRQVLTEVLEALAGAAVA